MNPALIIEKHYRNHARARRILIEHGRQVAAKALAIAGRISHLKPDLAFIEEAALLHDIGIVFTDTPKIGCYGNHPYVCHGILGRMLLEREGWSRHALVCERHVGVGMSREDIQAQRLPMPLRDMLPVSIEEQIICYADKFFSKNGLAGEKTLAEVVASLRPYGEEKIRRLEKWVERFEGPGVSA
jgi:uncharacterized protein